MTKASDVFDEEDLKTLQIDNGAIPLYLALIEEQTELLEQRRQLNIQGVIETKELQDIDNSLEVIDKKLQVLNTDYGMGDGNTPDY